MCVCLGVVYKYPLLLLLLLLLLLIDMQHTTAENGNRGPHPPNCHQYSELPFFPPNVGSTSTTQQQTAMHSYGTSKSIDSADSLSVFFSVVFFSSASFAAAAAFDLFFSFFLFLFCNCKATNQQELDLVTNRRRQRTQHKYKNRWIEKRRRRCLWNSAKEAKQCFSFFFFRILT